MDNVNVMRIVQNHAYFGPLCFLRPFPVRKPEPADRNTVNKHKFHSRLILLLKSACVMIKKTGTGIKRRTIAKRESEISL